MRHSRGSEAWSELRVAAGSKAWDISGHTIINFIRRTNHVNLVTNLPNACMGNSGVAIMLSVIFLLMAGIPGIQLGLRASDTP